MIRFYPPRKMEAAEPRGQDRLGSGAFGASRGSRKHNGVDYAVPPGSAVVALTNGHVSKVGHAYSDDLSYRYVEVTDNHGYRARYFYVEPLVGDLDRVFAGTVLGIAQDLRERYPDITPHVHFEVREPGGDIIDPAEYARRFHLTGESV